MYKHSLILGGKGFIGSHLVETILSHGLSVRVFDRADAENLIAANLQGQVEFIEGEFEDTQRVAAALEGCDICFHLISTTIPKTSNESPAYDLKSNALNSIGLLEQARVSGLKKIVFMSSGGTVYGIPKYLPIDELHPTNPLCSYGITKLTIEKYLELYRSLYGIDYVIARCSNPYGERQRLVAAQGAAAVFLGKTLNGEKITIWGDGSVARDYIYIGDLISGLMAIMNYSGKEHIFNIGCGKPTTILELIAAIESVVGKKARLDIMSSRLFDVPINVLDITRAKSELCWTPKVSLNDGLLRMKNWITN
jgi:UDP-glucose 4-epimerase